MPTKSFLVKVELTIHKLTCPGVWLCSNGRISLQLGMLDSNIQTETYKPTFPVVFDEKFIFYKTFLNERRLNELQRSLYREQFYAELIQWKNCDEGVVLANFKTTLDDLLYPTSFKKPTLTGSDVDLLMEPTKLFPGTISPKLQLKTKTTIEETVSDVNQKMSNKNCIGFLQKSPCFSTGLAKKLHQKKVCHTVGYSKAQQRCPRTNRDKRPIFKYRRPEDDLILRTNPDKVTKEDIIHIRPSNQYLKEKKDDNFSRKCSDSCPTCYCSKSVPLTQGTNTKTSFVRTVKTNRSKASNHDDIHEPNYCPVCSKYECTFFQNGKSQQEVFEEDPYNDDQDQCPYCGENYVTVCPWEQETSRSDKKVCFCLPKEKASRIAQRLQDRIRNTVHRGTTSLENCIRNCEVCE